jgi:hypothetical protein
MATVDQGLITRIAQQEGVDPALFNRLIMAESGGRSDAVSSAGAIGPAQLMPATAKELGVDPNDVEQNLIGGARYFRQQMERFGEPKLALAAYNAGPANVDKYGGVPPFAETQNYIAKILGSQTMADVTQPTAAPTAAPYDPMSNLSKSQRMMLAFGALRDAGAALTGKEGRSFATTLAGINDQQDMARKAQTAANQQSALSSLSSMSGTGVGVGVGQVQNPQEQIKKILGFAAAGYIDAATAKLYIDDIKEAQGTAQAQATMTQPVGITGAETGQTTPKNWDTMSVAEIDARIANDITPLLADPKTQAFAKSTIENAKTFRENADKREKTITMGSQSINILDTLLSDPNLEKALGFRGDMASAAEGTLAASMFKETNAIRGLIKQFAGNAFLEAFNSLKGGGTITEEEGKKATAAQARLNTAVDLKDFRDALKDARELVASRIKKAGGKVGDFTDPFEAQTDESNPKVRVFDPTTGTFK